MTDSITAFGLALLAQEQKINESSYYPTMNDYQKAQQRIDNEPSLPLKPQITEYRKKQLMYEDALKACGLPGCGSPTTKGLWSSFIKANDTMFIGGVDPIEWSIPQEKKLLLLI